MNGNNKVLGMDLDVIKSRLIIEGIIKLKTQMHIGTGVDDTDFSPESAILRARLNLEDELSFPYIPNSTIKGNMRSEIEMIANTLKQEINDKEYICNNYPEEICKIEKDSDERTKELSTPCLVCRIFGGSDLASHIIISDAFPTEKTKEIISTELKSGLKPGIAIDREKQVSRDGSLFFIETLQPGVEFNFKMIINNITEQTKPKEFKLLKSLFMMIKLGFLSYGGKKSTGMGRFTIENATVKHLYEKDHFLFPEDVQTIELYEFFGV
ncbi:MAG: RAMP superfamily CRISPR-associated protein [Candidatus Lokiarchaeia archaeon]